MKLLDQYPENGPARIWVQLHGHDLEWNEIGESDGTPEPEWLQYEMQEAGLDMIVGIDASTFRPEKRLGWLLKQGLAPEQPFCLEIGTPHYSTSYYGETNVEYDCDIVEKAPWTPERVAESLEKYLKRSQRYGLEAERALLLKKIRARSSLKNLYLQLSNYEVAGHTWHTPKHGVVVDVWAKNGNHWGERIASTRNDQNDLEACFRELMIPVKLEYPELSLATMRALPRRWL